MVMEPLSLAPCNRNIVGYEFADNGCPPDERQLAKYSSLTNSVYGAVERLQVLAKKIQSHAGKSTEDKVIDVQEISDVINILQCLDKDRVSLHQQLEVETITGSSLRHQLKCFPKDIEVEIRTAVEAARRLNEEDVQLLQDEAQATRDAICQFEAEKEALLFKIENSSPDHKIHQNDHAGLLSVLNENLADKASRQIKLNETIIDLEETYAKIEEYKIATEETKEEMVDDRVDADKEKENLINEIAQTREETSKQRRENIFKKREIEEQESLTNEKDKMLQDQIKQLRKLDKTNTKLRNQCEALDRRLRRKVKENTILTQEGVKIVKDSTAAVSTLTTIHQEWSIKLTQIETEAKRLQTDREKLKTAQIKLSNEHDIAKATSSRDKNEAEETERRLRSFKDDLLHQSDECTRLKQENTDMESTLDQIKQNHNATVEIFNKQIQDASTAVAREKKERHALQIKRDEIVKKINDLKAEHGEHVSRTQRKMKDNSREQESLLEKGTQLQAALRRGEITIHDYQSKIKDVKITYASLKKKLESDVDRLEENIEKLEGEMSGKNKELSVEEPKFADLKVNYAEMVENFDFTKKHVVDLNHKKAAIEATVVKIREDIQKLQEPKNQLWKEREAKGKEHLQELEDRAQAIHNVEQDIISTDVAREAIDKENTRFQEAIASLERDLEFVRGRMNNVEKQKAMCDHEANDCQSWLDVKWEEDLNLDKVYFERDIGLLNALQNITTTSSHRQTQVEKIHEDFLSQLQKLFGFIDTTEERSESTR